MFVIGFKFCGGLLLNFSVLERVSSCRCAADGSEGIAACVVVVQASKKEGIQVTYIHYYYNIIIIGVSIAQPTSCMVSASECGCVYDARISIKPIDLRQPADSRCDL
jgi:hypothetical protein